MRTTVINTSKTISTKSYTGLVYADDVDIIGRTMREVTSAFSKIEKE